MDKRIDTIIKGLRDYFKQAGFSKAVLGLSGGVDSALTAKLAVMALGAKNVTALLMPNQGISSDHSVIDATAFAEALGINYHVVPIDDFVETYVDLPWDHSEYADMNLQARVRATILYDYANTHHALVLGTGNKTEETLGYFTKYGDGAVDCLPIGSLYKTDVWAMGRELGLPEAILNKAPSAELRAGHTDESEIGMSYSEMDLILEKFEKGGTADSENGKKLMTRIVANSHKSKAPPVIPSR